VNRARVRALTIENADEEYTRRQLTSIEILQSRLSALKPKLFEAKGL
jgi:hypothetical protein